MIFDEFGKERVWNSRMTDPRGGLRAFHDFGDNILNDSDDLEDCLVKYDFPSEDDTNNRCPTCSLASPAS